MEKSNLKIAYIDFEVGLPNDEDIVRDNPLWFEYRNVEDLK